MILKFQCTETQVLDGDIKDWPWMEHKDLVLQKDYSLMILRARKGRTQITIQNYVIRIF